MNYNHLIIKETFALHAISGNKILCDHHFPPETSTANQLFFYKKNEANYWHYWICFIGYSNHVSIDSKF